MTYDEFLTELNALDVSWYIDQTYGPKKLLRTRDDERVYCPLTAVAKNATGHVYEVDEYPEAADELGMDYNEAEEIMRAADDETEYAKKFGMHPFDLIILNVIRGSLLENTIGKAS